MTSRIAYPLRVLVFSLIVLSLGLFGLCAPVRADAEAAPGLLGEDHFASDRVVARLLLDREAIVPGRPFEVALHLAIKSGWHTYWRFAGDSGAPTAIDWDLPPGFETGEIRWPSPERVPLGPLVNFGYEGEAVHFVTLKPPADLPVGEAVHLRAKADWLVCDDEMCIPESGSFDLVVPVAAEAPVNPEWGLMTAVARAALPAPAEFDVAYAVSGDTLQIQIGADELDRLVQKGEGLAFFPLEDGILQHSAPQAWRRAGDRAVLEVPAGYLLTGGRHDGALDGVLVAAGDERRGYEVSARPGEAVPLPPVAAAAKAAEPDLAGGFILAVLGAFVGGLILNLMPCVFPVLSMKALAFAGKAKTQPKQLRHHGWAYTVGVLMTFLGLAAVLMALRTGGEAVGWGYQLQSPLVVLGLAYLMFVVGLGLSGVFSLGASLSGMGGHLAALGGLPGSFFTGVLAVLVASPCTAPFMGAAMGYALVQPAWVGLGVFLALGAGLALPYLALSHFPVALALLPKPGPWMVRLKELLAFPMYATAAWLIWVLSQQIGPSGLFAVLIGLVLIALLAWLLRLGGGVGRLVLAGVAVIGLFALVAVIARSAPDAAAGSARAEAEFWTPFTPDRLAAALAAGTPVFIDFTAAWCVTCKVNEIGVLSKASVRGAFAERGVLALRADWTNRDPDISAMLDSYGRAGVPLYLYFQAGAAQPRILPQILSERSVLDALE